MAPRSLPPSICSEDTRNSQTILPSGLTSKAQPSLPLQTNVFPLGCRSAPEIRSDKNLPGLE